MPNKKILIITYYWPPAGGPGVQRWLKFVKYLPSYGFQPIVYVPDNPTYPIIDQGLLSEVSSEAIILKNKIFEPYQIATFFSRNKTKNISAGIIPNQKKQSFILQLLLWIRGNIFIPDARFLWVKPSVKFLHQYIIANDIQTIVTSGPPHSLHLIGYQLQKKVQVKWIADFRDPWTTIGYHKQLKLSAFAEKKHKKLEHQVLNAADAIIVTSKSTKIEFEKLTAKPVTVITNGFDTENNVKQTLDSKFSLSHIGSFLSERNPKILWESLSELCLEIENFKNNLQIKLIGAVSDAIFQTITDFKLTDNVLNLGYISHHDAIAEQRKSQVLLLIEIDSEDTKSIIPGKLFEYLVSGRPILAIGPKDSDFAEIIINTNTGVFFAYHQKQLLKAK
ncbi:MAG: glycosyltransferase family 4 protein, partial [Flavobacterium sp.]|nr:glycosyltransferase family 4 protein [Flavobacterium sp.]